MLLHVDISEIFIFIATRYGARCLGLPSLFFALPSLPFFSLSPYFTPTFLLLLPCVSRGCEYKADCTGVTLWFVCRFVVMAGEQVSLASD